MSNPDKDRWPRKDTSWRGRFRDRLAYRVATFAFEKIATPWYRKMVGGSIRYGLESAVRDERESRAIPTSVFLGRTSASALPETE